MTITRLMPWSLVGLTMPWFIACASTTSQSRPAAQPEPAPAVHETHGAHHADEHGPLATPPAEPTMPLPPDAGPAGDPASGGALSEIDAYERARPVFQRYCASCHTTAGERSRPAALRHFNMDSYPLGGHHTNEIAATVRNVLGTSGERATMPRDRPGVVQGDDLRLILEWADAFDRAHPPSHNHGGHHH